jgi:predicted aconitase
VEGVTPEARKNKFARPDENIVIEESQIREIYDKTKPDINDLDIITIGCPHCSPAELSLIAGLLEGTTVNKEVWICTSREVASKCAGIVKSIEKSGAKVICDTCMVVSPATEKYKAMMVNSGKALAYVPGMCGVPTLYGDIYRCIREAIQK